MGIDGCIYWPPHNAERTLKYDPHTDQASLVGVDFESYHSKWACSALAPDGVIYCIPSGANRILSIDPWGKFTATMKKNVEEYPQEFGLLFQIISDAVEDSDPAL